MIEPLADRILVKPIPHDEHSKGGIYQGTPTTTFCQDADKKKQQTVGEVLAIGPGKYDGKGRRRPPEAPIGSYVCFSDTCGIKISEGDEEYLFIREQDIMWFIDKPTNVELLYDS